ncbi:hypothetical protein [Rhizobium ruizarguesonis]|uniref:hypothetical protein n=1 Tax=Rhizobium ruizarguesonis TaxID=2081791 RepID=UPI001FE1344B|nr:hypothetical protein [Rhizobium ruizarguesonis]
MKRPIRKLVTILLLVWLSPGMLAVFVRMAGFNFLPSIEWTSKTNDLSIAAGLLPAAFLSWVAWKAMDVTPVGDGKAAIAMFSAPVFAYFLGKKLLPCRWRLPWSRAIRSSSLLPWQMPIDGATPNAEHKLSSRAYPFSSTQFAVSETMSG